MPSCQDQVLSFVLSAEGAIATTHGYMSFFFGLKSQRIWGHPVFLCPGASA